MKCTNTESSLYSNKHLIDTSISESQSHKLVSRPTATLQQSNVLITYAYREPRMHFCRVYLIFFGCVELCREQRRVGKRSARQARVSFGKNVLLPPPPLRPFSSASEGSWSDFVARESKTNEEEEPDIRRGAQERTRKRERGTRGERTDVQQRRAMQNLTVQGTGASDDGSREFVLVPPSRNFVSYSFFFSRRSVPVRSLARL